jgi:uncharacterized protein
VATEFGVKSLTLFGSMVRDEATPESDVDLLVEFKGWLVGLFHLSCTQHYLESILGATKVDLVLRDSIKPALKDLITQNDLLGLIQPLSILLPPTRWSDTVFLPPRIRLGSKISPSLLFPLSNSIYYASE